MQNPRSAVATPQKLDNWGELSLAITKSDSKLAAKSLTALWQEAQDIEITSREGKSKHEYTAAGTEFLSKWNSALSAAITQVEMAKTDDDKKQAYYVMRQVFAFLPTIFRIRPEFRAHFEEQNALNTQINATVARMESHPDWHLRNEILKLGMVDAGLGYPTNFYSTARPFDDPEVVFDPITQAVLAGSPRLTQILTQQSWVLPDGVEGLDGVKQGKKGPNPAYTAYTKELQKKQPPKVAYLSKSLPQAIKPPGNDSPSSSPAKKRNFLSRMGL